MIPPPKPKEPPCPMKQPPLTRYEKQLRAALREAIRVFGEPEECTDCGGFLNEDSPGEHDDTCIVTMMRSALKRPL